MVAYTSTISGMEIDADTETPADQSEVSEKRKID
jgi:hypothetical protein